MREIKTIADLAEALDKENTRHRKRMRQIDREHKIINYGIIAFTALCILLA